MTAGDGVDPRHGAILAIDTATDWIVVGLARSDGTELGGGAGKAGRMHGELLLRTIEGHLAACTRCQIEDLAAVIVGTGPGTFTGLRIGIATAKGIAHGLGIPIVGVSTAAVLQGSHLP